MDRRSFLAGSGLAIAGTALPAASSTPAIAAAPATPQARIDFVSDGLGLDPGEYAAQLQERVAGDGFVPDYYSRGGVVARLEQLFARLLGKPAAMFVATGTLANLLAVRRLAGNDRRVLVQAESHLYNDSGDGAQLLAGLNLLPLAPGAATPRLAEVQEALARSRSGRVRNEVGVISIETPVRRLDHAMADFAELQRISQLARAEGIRLHLDGARLFSLPLHSGRAVQEYTALFDSVYVSLWKHFNGASGAILAGGEDFIEGLYHDRRMHGGALPAAWPQVARAERYAESFQDDYARAWQVADALLGHLRSDRRFGARKLADGSSRFFLSVDGADPAGFAERLRARGIRVPSPRPDGALPLQVNPTLLRADPAALARRFVEALDG